MSILNSNNFLYRTVDDVKQFFSPLVNASTVVLKDGSRLEKDGKIHADETTNFSGYTFEELKAHMLNLAHPVGSYYWSAEETDPSVLFGGTWEPIYDRFLLSAGWTYGANTTGGEATHTLTVDEMPSHSHAIFLNNSVSSSAYWNMSDASPQGTSVNNATANAGGSQPHNNMPPYLVAYCWRRTA